MKKLTAGIFAGILTIVTVNAADAAIASKAYVDQQRDANAAKITSLTATVGEHTTDITNLKTGVADNKADISDLTGVVGASDQAGLRKEVADLKTTVGNLSGGGAGSVADQIADALGDIPEGSTVQGELEKKANKADLGTMAAKNAEDYSTTAQMNAALANKLDTSKATVAADANYIKSGDGVATNLGLLDTQVKGNADSISGINTKIGTLPEGETNVVTMIQKVGTTAGTNLTDKLGDLGGKTVAAALAEKQDMLDGENVVTNGTGNVITAVTAENGTVTVKKGMVMPEVPATAKGETGTYVLTATVTDTGITNYMWESIERAAAQSENP